MMSKLDELIAELCPDGVEFLTIGAIANFRRGSFPQPYGNSSWYGGTLAMPFVQVADLEDKAMCLKDNTKQTISKLAQPMSVFVPKGTVLVSLQGTIGRVAITQYDSYVDRTIAIFTDYIVEIDKKYFAYQLKAKFEYEKKFARGSTLKTITKEEFTNFKLPVPPLDVQREIVRILDELTVYQNELTDKLAAELAARKKQYEYYRDSLLTFSDDVPKMKLGDIATEMYRGAGIKRDEVTTDGIPCIRYGEIYTDYEISFTECVSHTSESVVANPKLFDYGDIIFTITGENVEEIAKSVVYLGDKQCMAGGDTVVMKHNQEPRFMSYVLSTTSAQAQKSKGKVKSKVVHSSVPALKEIIVPIPDIETQKRIADILDNFRLLINDISQGLPAEIEMRRKQYEYYRDKLLTFKEKEA